MTRVFISSLIAVTGLVFTSSAFAECPSCASVKALETAIDAGVKGYIGATGDLIGAEKLSSEHGAAGGTYRITLSTSANGKICTTDVKVTRETKPNDPPGSIHFSSEVISSTCSKS